MKKVKGFITENGTFFENETEARLHEAEMMLRHKLGEAFPKINQDALLGVVLTTIDEMREYIHAHDQATTNERDHAEDGEKTDDSTEAETGSGAGVVTGTEEDLVSILKLPARGPKHVSDVGSGSRTEEVSDGREEHGARGRDADARGVRGGKGVATRQDSKAAESRKVGRREDF